MTTKNIRTFAALRDRGPDQSVVNHAREVYDAHTAHWAAMNDIMNSGRRGKDGNLLASDARRYDAHEAEYDALDSLLAQLRADHPELNEVDRSGVLAPAASDRSNDRTPLLRPQQRLADWPTNQRAAQDQDPDGEVRFGAMLAAWVTGDRGRLNNREMNALQEGTSSAGGIMVPTPTAARFIDRARNASRVFQAGATTVPMDSRTLTVPRLTGSTAPAWRNESAAIASGDMTFDGVTLTGRTLAFRVNITRELVEDARDPDILNVVEGDLAAQVALEMDRVALRGTGTAPEPRGVKNTSGVTTITHGANGDTTANLKYDFLIDAVAAVRALNFEPNAQIDAPRTEQGLAKLKDTTGQYIQPPPGLPQRLTTNQIPINLVTGSSNDTSEVYTGQWPMLYFGMRTGPLFIQLSERYMADNGEFALIVWFRGDVALAQPGAFAVDTGVRG